MILFLISSIVFCCFIVLSFIVSLISNVETMDATDLYNGTIMLSKMGSFKPIKNTTIGSVVIMENMHIEFDLVIHSFPSSGWVNIIHCSDDNYPRLPGIWLYETSDSGAGFHVKFSNDDNVNYGLCCCMLLCFYPKIFVKKDLKFIMKLM